MPTLKPMCSRSSLSKLLILTALFLSACTGTISLADLEALNDPEGTENTLSAADINAAAEQAATAEPPSQPTETSPPDTSATGTPPPPIEEPRPIPTDERPKTNPRVEVPNVSVNWLLPWDGIRPVYNPEFASAAEAPLDDEELVLAISIGEEAKAYPISVLGHREMVNDEMAGIPTLVTW